MARLHRATRLITTVARFITVPPMVSFPDGSVLTKRPSRAPCAAAAVPTHRRTHPLRRDYGERESPERSRSAAPARDRLPALLPSPQAPAPTEPTQATSSTVPKQIAPNRFVIRSSARGSVAARPQGGAGLDRAGLGGRVLRSLDDRRLHRPHSGHHECQAASEDHLVRRRGRGYRIVRRQVVRQLRLAR
jgi:hypothetical protein